MYLVTLIALLRKFATSHNDQQVVSVAGQVITKLFIATTLLFMEISFYGSIKMSPIVFHHLVFLILKICKNKPIKLSEYIYCNFFKCILIDCENCNVRMVPAVHFGCYVHNKNIMSPSHC